MTALQQCLEWARTGFRGVSVHRYVTDGREPYYGVDLWDHDSHPVRNALGYGASQEEAARNALADASDKGLLDSVLAARGLAKQLDGLSELNAAVSCPGGNVK